MNRIIIAMLILVGCGMEPKKDHGGSEDGGNAPSKAGDNPVSAGGPTSFRVDQASNLPPCNNGHAQEVAYVSSEKKLYGCDGTSWAALDLSGAPAQTATAATTAPAAPSKIQTQITCGGKVDNGYSVTYSVSVTSTGDAYASATLGAHTISSGQAIYAAGSKSSPAAPVQVSTGDASPWSVSLDRTALVLSVVMDAAHNYTLPASACSSASY